MNTKYLKVCIHNHGVDCTGSFDCDTCAWNPANEELRQRRVEKALENKNKPNKIKVKPLPAPNCKKPVYCPELGKTFGSISEASRETGVDATSIYRILSGKRYSGKGLTFVEV